MLTWVATKNSADFENKSSYSFNVIATDNGIGNLSAKSCYIKHYNTNDAPIVSIPIIDIFVNENSTTVSNFNSTFSDPDDESRPFRLLFSLVLPAG